MIKGILGILGIIVMILIVGTAVFWIKENFDKKKAIIAGVVLGAIGLVVVLFVTADRVHVGNVGIQRDYFRGVQDEVLKKDGLYFKITREVINFPTSYETLSMRDEHGFSVNSKTGQPVEMGVELEYHYDVDQVVDTYRKLGGMTPQEIEDIVLKGKIRSILNTIAVNYPANEIYSHKVDEMKAEATEKLTQDLSPYGIKVNTFNIFSQNPNVDAQKIIAEKESEAGRLEVAQIRTKTIEEETRQREIEAESRAKITKIDADARAESNRILQNTLTDNVLQKLYIDKWDGQMPKVMGQNGSIMNVSDIVK